MAGGAEKIRAIRRVEDLNAWETSESSVFSCRLASFQIENSMADSGNYTVEIYSTELFLEDPGEYFQQTEDGRRTEEYCKNVVCYMLDRLGYSREEADQVWSGCRAFEAELAEHMLTREELYSDDIYDKIINTCTLEELGEAQGNYPLVEVLKADGMDGSDTYNLTEPEWLSALGKLYTEEHVEDIKDYLLAHYVFKTARKTDRDAYDAV